MTNNTRPDHYKVDDPLEVINIIEHYSSVDEYIGFLTGNIIKYILRYKNKNGVEDLKKARVYLDWLIEKEENLNDVPKCTVRITQRPELDDSEDFSKWDI